MAKGWKHLATINKLESFPKGQLTKEIRAFDKEMRIMASPAWKKEQADKLAAMFPNKNKKKKNKEND